MIQEAGALVGTAPDGGALAAVLVLAVVLGLRHSTDPDHLTAVATLVVSDPEAGVRRAGRLGLAWGLGHGVTLFLLGLPVVFLGRSLPEAVYRGAEVLVGAVIVALAVRLLVRWRRGYFHVHVHEHEGEVHAHPHFHEPGSSAPGSGHETGPGPGRSHGPVHSHPHGPERSPAAAFGVGLVHGVGGSAGAGVLVVAALSNHGDALMALLLFASAAAVAMAAVSAGVGHVLVVGRREALGLVGRAVPVLGALALAVGVWYSLGALGAVPPWR